MPTDVIVPPLGQTVDTLILVSWYKHEGDLVRQGEPLFVVETDKATLDVEAPASGTLGRVTAQPGDEVQTLSAVAIILAPGELEAENEIGEIDLQSAIEPLPSTSSVASSSPPSRLLASPRARRLADQEGVALASLSGTGPEGAIVERDVRAFLQRSEVRGRIVREQGRSRGEAIEGAGAAEAPETLIGAQAKPPISPVARRIAEQAGLDWRSLSGSGPSNRILREDVERALRRAADRESPTSSPQPLTPGPQSPVPDLLETIPMRSVRALIAQRMHQSHSHTAPVTLTSEVDATALVELRRRLADSDVAVSYNDLFLMVAARALRLHPRLNASLDGDTIKLWRRIDIGLAVDTDRGLLVPVIRDVDNKGLGQVARERSGLIERARSGRLLPDELRGGTFTITNLGMFGIDAFTPIINLPETAILGLGRIKEKPAMLDGQVVGRQMIWLSLTFDHRLVDGGLAARFLHEVAQFVVTPALLLA